MMVYETPNIDRRANEGTTFTDCYAEQSSTADGSGVVSNYCSETRTVFIAGSGECEGNANNSFSVPAGFAAAANTVSQNLDIVSLRVNYKFGGPVAARY